MKKHKGFTLIELLVVIAIISILAAILFPVFAAAREKARQITCASNERQLALGIMQYEQDYDEMTPIGDNQYGEAVGWGGDIYTYVKSTAVYICPDDPTKFATSSYAYNSNLCSYVASSATTSGYIQDPISIAQMSAPSKTVQLCEVTGNSVATQAAVCSVATEIQDDVQCSPSGVGLSVDNRLNGLSAPAVGGTLRFATGWMYNSGMDGANHAWYAQQTGRHSGGSNFVMCDGHVKWMMPSAVGAGNDAPPGNHQSIDPVPVGQNACGGVPDAGLSAPATDCSLAQVQATFAFH